MRYEDAIAAFRRDFIVQTAQTPDEIQEAFRLRHQVYCLERGYEAATAAGEERDEYDRNARHVIALDSRTGQVVGTTRLIMPGRARDAMPIRRLCNPSLLRDLPVATTAEVSRFAISKERRDPSAGDALLRLGLVQGCVRLSRDLGVTHWCAVMERSLLRLLCTTAIRFAPLGPVVEHHGIRQPCVARLDTILTEMAVEQPVLWDLVTDGGELCQYEPERLAA